MSTTNNTESNVQTDGVEEDKDSSIKRAFVATGHGLKVAGTAVVDTDLRDIGKATKRVFHGLSKGARAERTIRKAEAIKVEQRKSAAKAKKASTDKANA